MAGRESLVDESALSRRNPLVFLISSVCAVNGTGNRHPTVRYLKRREVRNIIPAGLNENVIQQHFANKSYAASRRKRKVPRAIPSPAKTGTSKEVYSET